MKILIIHFRSAPAVGWKPREDSVDQSETDSAGTDGVSLEMKKRRFLLEKMGHTVAICSAYEWAEFPLPELEFDTAETRKLMRNMFEDLQDFSGEKELHNVFDKTVAALQQGFARAVSDFSPDMIFVHNILCLPIHPAATVALTELLKQTKIPCTAINHDILSEGAYKFRPTCDFAQSVLQEYFPPTLPTLVHWTINTRNKKALEKKGIEVGIIHDTMDFDEQLDPADYCRLRNELRSKHDIQPCDVVLLVGARIVPNKQIEVAGELTAAVQKLCLNKPEQKLYNNELLSNQSRIVLVLAGRPEAAFSNYQQKLFDLLDSLKISWIYAGDIVRPLRSEQEGLYALYPDMYSMADFVLYPTGWEGFGNQLLEAFAAGLPVSVFEYPVFKEDIAPKGVSIVSLGDTIEKKSGDLVRIPEKTLHSAAQEILDVLLDSEKYSGIASNNIAVCKKHFSFDVLRAHLKDSLNWASSIEDKLTT